MSKWLLTRIVLCNMIVSGAVFAPGEPSYIGSIDDSSMAPSLPDSAAVRFDPGVRPAASSAAAAVAVDDSASYISDISRTALLDQLAKRKNGAMIAEMILRAFDDAGGSDTSSLDDLASLLGGQAEQQPAGDTGGGATPAMRYADAQALRRRAQELDEELGMRNTEIHQLKGELNESKTTVTSLSRMLTSNTTAMELLNKQLETMQTEAHVQGGMQSCERSAG